MYLFILTNCVLLAYACVWTEQVMDGCEEEGQVVVVGLRPASLDDVCYTELKPSTTLLVPIELATEHQELLHGTELPEVGLPVTSNNFSLMLEADDDEPAALEMDAENHPTLQGNIDHAGDMEEEPNANSDNVEHVVLEPEEMLKTEELPSETVVPNVVQPNKLVDKVQMGQEMTESEPKVEDQPDEPAKKVQPQLKLEAVAEPETLGDDQLDEAQVEHTEEKRELRPDSDPADEAQTAEEPVEKPLEFVEESVKELVTKDTFDVSSQIQDLGLAEVKEDDLVHNEKLPDGEGVVEGSEMVPVPEDHVSDANRAEEKDAKLKEAVAATEVQQSPARRKKTVIVPVTLMESEQDASEEHQADSKVPSTPRRVTRSSKQLLESEVLITPRRSTRKTGSEVKEEAVPSAKAAPPRKTPQKATPRRGSRKTRSSSGNDDLEVQKMEETSIVEQQSARKTRKVATIEVPELIPEEKFVENQPGTNASPGRVTRQSSRRLSLTLDNFQMVSDAQNTPLFTPPRSRRKARGTTEEKTKNETCIVDSTQLKNISRRLTRSQHWNDGEELEKLESTNLLESALMERLKDEQAKETDVVTQIVRAKRRTRSVAPSVDHEEQNAEAPESVDSTEQQEQKKKSAPPVRRTRASKVPEPDTSPVSDRTSGAQKMRGERAVTRAL